MDTELYEILCRKAGEGMTASVIILNDEINSGGYGLDFNKLQNTGGNINLIGSQEEMMRNKFCVIANKVVITGSYNWTNKAKVNDENIMVTKNSLGLGTNFIIIN